MEDKTFNLDSIISKYSSQGKQKNSDDGPYNPSNPYESIKDYKPDGPYSPDVPLYSIAVTAKRTPMPAAALTRYEICDWIESMILSVATVILVIVFVARVNQVFGSSMQPTLTEGDRLIVMPLYSMPKYGDIIVLEAQNLPSSTKPGELGEPIVKRVIGLPGDVINIDPENGDVIRNNTRLTEEYIAQKINPDKIGNQVYPLTIKEGTVFVLGDNRNHSTDSRVAEGGSVYYVGLVDAGNIIGKAVLRVYPFENFGGLG